MIYTHFLYISCANSKKIEIYEKICFSNLDKMSLIQKKTAPEGAAILFVKKA